MVYFAYGSGVGEGLGVHVGAAVAVGVAGCVAQQEGERLLAAGKKGMFEKSTS